MIFCDDLHFHQHFYVCVDDDGAALLAVVEFAAVWPNWNSPDFVDSLWSQLCEGHIEPTKSRKTRVYFAQWAEQLKMPQKMLRALDKSWRRVYRDPNSPHKDLQYWPMFEAN